MKRRGENIVKEEGKGGTIRILVLHGPNLNLLGLREPEIYGSTTLEEVNRAVVEKAASLGFQADCFQSNHEGEIVDCVQQAAGNYSGMVINPAALTHYSLALHDALKAVGLPVVEVHISNIYAREEFRRVSVVSPAAQVVISGAGTQGYLLGLEALCSLLNKGG